MSEQRKVPKLRFPEFTDDWEQRKLGDIFKEYSEKNHPELPALSIIQGEGTILRDDSDRNLQYDKSSLSNYKMVQKDDFIVHLRSFEGGLEKSNHNGLISPAYHTLHGDKVDSRFYYPYFRSYEFINHRLVPHVFGIRDGKSIDISGMKTISIPYTSYSEQQKIGDCIESINKVITLHQRKCEVLKKLKKGLLQKMFPKDGTNIPEIRFPEFTDAWEQREFSSIAERISKTSQSSASLPSIEFEDIISEQGLLNKDLYSKKNVKSGIKFECNDILFGKLRPYLKNWLFANFTGVAVGDFWVLRGENISPLYLYYLIQTDSFMAVANTSTGTKMPRSDWKLVSSSIFFKPTCKDEQSKIGNLFRELDSIITLHQRKLEVLKKLKKGLLQQMFV